MAPATTTHAAGRADQHDTRRHRCRSWTVATDCRRFRLRPASVVAAAALNDQQKCPGLTYFAHLSRPRGGRRCWRREIGGGVRQHPGSTTAVTGLLGSLAERSVSRAAALACELDLRGADLRQPAVRCGERRWWWWRWARWRRRGSLAGTEMAPATTTHAAGRADQHDTRRHRCRSW